MCKINVLDIDTVGVQATFTPCAQPLSMSLDITEADVPIDYPIASLTAGTDEEIPIPGLVWTIVAVSAQANMAVKIDGNLDAVTISLGVDACASIFGFQKCGSDLTSDLPIYILNDQFDFSELCGPDPVGKVAILE